MKDGKAVGVGGDDTKLLQGWYFAGGDWGGDKTWDETLLNSKKKKMEY